MGSCAVRKATVPEVVYVCFQTTAVLPPSWKGLVEPASYDRMLGAGAGLVRHSPGPDPLRVVLCVWSGCCSLSAVVRSQPFGCVCADT
jgi:hypothetical protein